MNVGDYVRTKNKGIKKIIGLYSNAIFDGFNRIENHQIIKSSPQIIDLIEVGDYVNGLPVIKIYNENECYDNSSYKFTAKAVEVKNDDYECIPFGDIFKNEEIKTIITHERFSAMEYKVGD